MVLNCARKKIEITGNIIYGDKMWESQEIEDNIDKMFCTLLTNAKILNNSVIAIGLPRSYEYLIADLMSLKYGITFLNLDMNLPINRIKFILNNSNVDVVITIDKYRDNFESYQIVCVDDYLNENSLQSVNKHKFNNNVAYILYTSGTTGKPKGVEVTRQGLYNFLEGIMERIDVTETRTMISFTNQTFDIFFLELLIPILNKKTLILAGNHEINNPRLIIKLLKKHSVDMIQITPSRIRLIRTVDKRLECFKKIKILMVGGEKFPQEIYTLLKYNNINIYNMYGPTEATIWTTISNVNEKKITIGKPIKNTKIYILDEKHKNLENGKEGEIAIAGVCLAKGYKNNEELTRKKFIKVKGERVYLTGDMGKYTNNGDIEFLGRKDFQVKVNGHRIELEEIDNILNKMRNIKNSLTCFYDKKNELISFYCAEKDIDKNDFINYLNRYLPYYMIPKKFIRTENIEYTLAGKSDRKGMLKRYICEQRKEKILDNVKEHKSIEDKILELFIKQKNTNIDKQTLFEELLLDSIEFVSIIVEVETIYNIEFDDDYMQYSKYKTVGDFIKYIAYKVNKRL